MITVAAAREDARKRLRRHMSAWATARSDDTTPLVTIPLKPPTERQMLTDEATAEDWVRSWRAVPLDHRALVEWETRTWRSIGRQQVPTRLRLGDADAVAAFAGGSVSQDYARLRTCAEQIYARFGETDALASAIRRHAATFISYPEHERTTVLDVVAWLAANDVAGLRPRQLPIRGVDSKWFTNHRAVVTALHTAVTGQASLGVVDSDPLVRVRILDASIASGVTDYAAPVAQLAKLDLAPRAVLVVENLETLLALPDWSGVVAVHGSGYAVDVLGRIPWVLRSPVVYWGDLDSHGFAILHRLRTLHTAVSTVLMDTATLDAHRDLCVPEPQPARGTYPTLTETESATLEELRIRGDLRLEQERIPWACAVARLEEGLADVDSDP